MPGANPKGIIKKEEHFVGYYASLDDLPILFNKANEATWAQELASVNAHGGR